jgi:hypothetical protein
MRQYLIIKTKTNGIVAIVASENNVLRVVFAYTNNLRIALEETIKHGLHKRRFVTKTKLITINASPKDADFLKKLKQYLILSFDYDVKLMEIKNEHIQHDDRKHD